MQHDAESIQSILQGEFQRRVRMNSRYSLRAFARAMGLSCGALSEILRNRRPVSTKTALQISKSLGYTASEAKQFLKLVDDEKRSKLPGMQVVPLAKNLDGDTFSLVSDWQHFAILNLLDCEGFRWNSVAIAKRLGLTQTQAKLAMDLLIRVGLVKVTEGRAVATEAAISFSDGVPSAAVRSYHRQILEKAIESLELRPIDEREMNGVGFAIDPKKLPQVKRDISDFLNEIVSKYSRGKRHEVVFLETALFQITNGEKR